MKLLKVKKTKKADAYPKVLQLLDADIERFCKNIENGYGWIVEGDIVRQFNDFTGGVWDIWCFDKKRMQRYIIHNVSESNIEVFDNLAQAQKAGYEL